MERFLVALDRSPASAAVLASAIELAKSTGAKLRLMTAVMPPPLPPPGAFVPPSAAFDVAATRRSAEAALHELESSVPPEMRDGIMVEVGSAAERICALATSESADVVVIGSGRHGALRRALGTTAAKVVNRADCPVFVVRESSRRPAQPASAEAPAPGGRGHADHRVLEAATLTGIATGAVAGSPAGVPGVVVGGVAGAVVGLIAGEAIEDSETDARHPRP